ncbi:MAG: SDR family oxidoreductase [Pseudomonadota bacterium]
MRIPPDLLSGEAALVTGSAVGNGAAIAKGLAAAGAAVALCDLDAQGAEVTAGAIRSAGGAALAVEADVSDVAACARFAKAARDAHGPASILINNAGVIHREPVGHPDYAKTWDRSFRINVDGTRNMLLAALDDLTAGQGRVVNLASILSTRASPDVSAYAATKGAIAQLTRAWALELSPKGVRVNALAPGVINTPMTLDTREDPEALAGFLRHTPMGRIGEPEELVGPTLFLVSPWSSYVTGAVLPVDGGYLTL